MRKFIRFCLLFMLCLVFNLPTGQSNPALAQGWAMHMPYGFVDEPIAADLKIPTGFAIAPDGRIFITQKAGQVRVVDNGELQEGYFIDLSGEVNTTADRGLMGVAVHPDFPNTPYVYLSYVYDPPEAKTHNAAGARVSRLLRVSADPNNLNVALPGSGVVLLGTNSTFANIGNPDVGDQKPFTCFDNGGGYVRDCLPLEGTSHALNFMRFARDGSLYVSNGDGINFTITNIRAQDPNSLAGKILRINPIDGNGYPDNPFCNGDLGGNACKVYALGLRNPFRFAIQPSTGELIVGEVGNNNWEEISRGGAGANFGWPCYEGPDIVTSSNAVCDEIFSGARPTVSAILQYPHENGRGAAIAGDFYTGSSYPAFYRNTFFFADYNVGMLRYLVFYPDGSVEPVDFATNVLGPVQITAGPNGDLYVLKIQSGGLSRIRYGGPVNNASAAPRRAATGNPPVATITSPSADNRYRIGDTIEFSGTGIDPEDGELSGASMQWDAILHHATHIHYDHFHGEGESGSFPYVDHGDNTYFELCLTVKDSGGQEDKECVDVRAQEVTYTFTSVPSGLPLIYAGGSYVTPFKVNTYVNAKRAVDAPQKTRAGLNFASWSDEGEATHEITIQDSDQTLTATYADSAGTPVEASGDEQEAAVVNVVVAPTATPDTSADDAPSAAAPSAAAAPTSGGGTGSILREWWTDIGGKAVVDLTKSAKFSGKPKGKELLTSFEAPASFGNDYGTRISGYLYPPTDGEYRFWIASDDSGELWLSSDDNPANKKLIAFAPDWTRVQEWDKYPEQQSVLITLEAGQRYYIEALHKEADQKDNLAVAWEGPGVERAVINGVYLSPP